MGSVRERKLRTETETERAGDGLGVVEVSLALRCSKMWCLSRNYSDFNCEISVHLN